MRAHRPLYGLFLVIVLLAVTPSRLTALVALPALSIDDATFAESAGAVTINVTLSAPAPETITVDYTFGVITPNATWGMDFTGEENSLTFETGDSLQTIGIAIVDDDIYESSPQQFSIVLSNPSPAGVTFDDSTATVTINDNDAAPTAALHDAQMLEGDSGAAQMMFTIDYSHPFETVGQLVYQFTPQSGTAAAGVDFDGAMIELVYNDATISSITFPVSIYGDVEFEGSETFTVGGMTGTILNDDSPVTDPDNLLANGDFEAKKPADPAKPDLAPWTVANGTGDKVKCGALGAGGSDCAFVFKGGPGEASSLKQKLLPAPGTFAPGDKLTIAYSYAAKSGVKLKGKVKVTFAGGATQIIAMPPFVSTNALYTPASLTAALDSASVTRIDVSFSHKSASGKAYLDGVGLTYGADGRLPPP